MPLTDATQSSLLYDILTRFYVKSGLNPDDYLNTPKDTACLFDQNTAVSSAFNSYSETLPFSSVTETVPETSDFTESDPLIGGSPNETNVSPNNKAIMYALIIPLCLSYKIVKWYKPFSKVKQDQEQNLPKSDDVNPVRPPSKGKNKESPSHKLKMKERVGVRV